MFRLFFLNISCITVPLIRVTFSPLEFLSMDMWNRNHDYCAKLCRNLKLDQSCMEPVSGDQSSRYCVFAAHITENFKFVPFSK